MRLGVVGQHVLVVVGGPTRVDPEMVPTVVGFARGVTEQVGLGTEAAERLGRTLDEVCRNVIEYAYSPGEERLYEVEILRRAGRVVVAVEDMGLPFDYAHLGDEVDIRPEDVRTGSDSGRELAHLVFEAKRSVES